jgi:hypothetical protein
VIGWLVPAALGGLALVVLPIVVHLLRTHRARRIQFPTLRFIAPSRTSAVKLRPPSEIPLLFVRLGTIAAAALAMAQPVWLTQARVDSWNNRLARAVVVDTSEAMQVADASGTKPAELAKPIVDAEIAAAMTAIRIDTPSLTDGLTRAAAWLATAPPARREVVVVSTFRAGSVDASAIGRVPASVGLRLVQVGSATDSRTLTGVRPLTAPGSPGAAQAIQLIGPKTSVSRQPGTAAQRGWRVVGLDATAPGMQRLWRTLATAGAPAPSPDQPIALAFGDLPSDEHVAPFAAATPRWMLQTLARLRSDDGLRRATTDAPPSSLMTSDRWVPVAVDRAGAPLVRAARASQELMLQIGAPVDSLFGAAAARALLNARAGEVAQPELEILRLPPATLTGWSKPAPLVDPAAWRSRDGSDARWLWAIAIALLAVEAWMRRSSAPPALEVRDAA